MTAHVTHVYSAADPSAPCFAACDCSWLSRCGNRDAALEAGRVHLLAVETDRVVVLAAQVGRDLLRLDDALELVAALRRSISTAEDEIAALNTRKEGAA